MIGSTPDKLLRRKNLSSPEVENVPRVLGSTLQHASRSEKGNGNSNYWYEYAYHYRCHCHFQYQYHYHYADDYGYD